MFIQEMKRGVPIVLTFGGGLEIMAEFDGSLDHRKFYVRSKEIAKNIENVANAPVEFKYHDSSVFYTFTGNIIGVSTFPGQRDVVEAIATSAIKEVPRRLDFRITISLRFKIHEFVGNRASMFMGEYLGDGVSDDISKTGVRVWSDYNLLDRPIETMFTLEVTLPYGSIYFIPSKLMRNQRNPDTRSYAYDYGFAFDFSYMPSSQDKLFVEILESKMRR